MQIRFVICRPRDKYGRLVRRDKDLPDWVEVDEDGMRIVSNPKPYSTMYQQVKRRQGLSTLEAKAAWDQFLKEHPGFNVLGD